MCPLNKSKRSKPNTTFLLGPLPMLKVQDALSHSRPNTSSGNDSACYTTVRDLFAKDSNGKLVGFFSDIVSGKVPVPVGWTKGKLCFLPKCARPSRPQDLRPISLTPCLRKLFACLLVTRLAPTSPLTMRDNMPVGKEAKALKPSLAHQPA